MTDLVEGPTLDYLIASGPQPLPETLNIARQIALALEAAHDKNVVHRDLKPANVTWSSGQAGWMAARRSW